MTLSSKELSSHRQRIRHLLDALDRQAFSCAQVSPLIQGVASEVFRRCGKKGCKCVNDADRHGPYLVIQLYENKKQRQVSLRKDQKQLWQQAKDYQAQLKSFLELKKSCQALLDEVETVLEKRLVKWEKA